MRTSGEKVSISDETEHVLFNRFHILI